MSNNSDDLAPDKKAPRKKNGQWDSGGGSANPGGLPKSARGFKRQARYAASVALDKLKDQLVNDELTGRDLVAAAKLLADHGGYITAIDQAKLLMSAASARANFPDEASFLRFVAATQGKLPVATQELPASLEELPGAVDAEVVDGPEVPAAVGGANSTGVDVSASVETTRTSEVDDE